MLLLYVARADFKSNNCSNDEFPYHNVRNYRGVIFQLETKRLILSQ